MKGFTRDGVLLGVSSIVLAVMLYLHVSLQIQPTKQVEFQLPLEPKELDESLLAIEYPKTATILAEASPDLVNSIKSTDLTVAIDMSAAREGRRNYQVEWSAPSRFKPYLTLKQPLVQVVVAKKKVADIEVSVERTGTISQEYLSDESKDVVVPSRVRVVGPEQVIDQIERAQASLNLAQVSPGGIYPSSVILLDKEGKRIESALIEMDPRNVVIRPLATAAQTNRALIVVPKWRGQPAFGFRVKDYEFVPREVEINGSPQLISGLSTIETEPIDIGGLKASKTIVVKLKPPPRETGVLDVDSVEVRVVIEAAR